MKKYQVVNKALTLQAGTLELSAEQAKVRTHALKRVRGEVYEITGPVCFKVGERIGYDGDLPKALADNLKTPAELKAAAEEAARAADVQKSAADPVAEAPAK